MHFPGEPIHPVGNLVAGWLKRLALLPRSFLLQETILEGLSPEGSPLQLAYLGEGESLPYLKNLIFREAASKKTASSPCWRLRQRAAAPEAAGRLLIVEVNRLLAFLLPPGGFISYPWVRQKIFLKGEQFRGRRRWIEGDSGRKVRKYGYRPRLAGVAAVAPFYQHFYVPYLKCRFGGLTRHRSLRELQRAVRSGFLLQVWEGDTWVAGEIYCRQGDTLFLLGVGCLPDYKDRLQRGALAACQYFGMQWALTHDIQVLDLFRSRPHAGDGVFQHKSRWGAEALVDDWVHTVLWLSPPQELPGVLEKFLVLRDKGLVELSRLHPLKVRGG